MASPGTCPPLAGRHILLGITGSIAAYKAAVLCRLLKTAGADVRVVMTPLAKQFITPLTMATLSKNPILVEFFDPENGAWNSHVSLGEWADCYLIAPATANTLAKMAGGIADNLLLTTYLSARCPVVAAPAMDLDMYAHAATQQNLRTLAERGVRIVEPGEGELASGLTGKGRMAEPEAIAAFVGDLLREKKKSLQGKRLIVTAGATIEAIDPVRFISNHSSGKMGYAIAGELAGRGAEVTLVGPGPFLPARPDVLGAKSTRDFDALLPDLDVVYMLRVQQERMEGASIPSTRDYSLLFGLDERRAKLMAPQAVVMHPGPINRGVEMCSQVADAANSLITSQVNAGVSVRMAVIYLLLGGEGNVVA